MSIKVENGSGLRLKKVSVEDIEREGRKAIFEDDSGEVRMTWYAWRGRTNDRFVLEADLDGIGWNVVLHGAARQVMPRLSRMIGPCQDCGRLCGYVGHHTCAECTKED
jgi:hypothetical protein